MAHDTQETPAGFRIPDIFIARDGVWFCDGQEVVHEKIFRLFNESLHRDGGDYYIEVSGQRCPVRVERAPFVVRNLYPENTEQGRDVIWLVLNSGRAEALRPETLRRETGDELFCTLENGLDAALNRHAAAQLGQFLEQDESGAFFISLNGIKYSL